jgi:undecaprenyl-diphosphatase
MLQAALLGVVQGLTEFLPVSSSAHLILARAFFGFDADKFGLSFDVACHVGTLVAVVLYFREDVAKLIAAVPQALGLPRASATLQRESRGPARAGHSVRPGDAREGGHHARTMTVAVADREPRLVWLLVVGTIPAVVAGLLFGKVIEARMRTPAVVALTLAVGAILMLAAERVGRKTRDEVSLTMTEAFWIGCAQAVALIPGVSRSGATLTLALFLGLRRPEAARFIFLLAIPAILGAAAHEAPKVLKAGFPGDTAALFVVGVVTSAIVGYLAVKYFIRYLANNSLDVFAWYRLALAATVVVWIFRT